MPTLKKACPTNCWFPSLGDISFQINLWRLHLAKGDFNKVSFCGSFLSALCSKSTLWGILLKEENLYVVLFEFVSVLERHGVKAPTKDHCPHNCPAPVLLLLLPQIPPAFLEYLVIVVLSLSLPSSISLFWGGTRQREAVWKVEKY